MDNYSKMYWLTRLDPVHHLLVFISAIIFIGIAVYGISYLCKKDIKGLDAAIEWHKKFKHIVHRMSAMFIFLIIVLTLLPSKKDVVIIVLGAKTLDFTQTDSSISKIPSQATQVISDFLDDEIKTHKK